MARKRNLAAVFGAVLPGRPEPETKWAGFPASGAMPPGLEASSM